MNKLLVDSMNEITATETRTKTLQLSLGMGIKETKL